MITQAKKVSIVLPVYNGADYISDSINSIIDQTYQNWELIVVDDCSTDNTLNICNRLAGEDDRIRVISNENNLKLPGALNVGFSFATGDYYSWTSDDNMYKTYAIETLVGVMEQNPDVDMVYADYTNIDEQGNVLYEYSNLEPQYLATCNVFGSCFLYTADIAKRVGGYDQGLFLAEDYDYWMRIYRHGKVLHLPENLYYYRRHGASLTETKKASIREQTYKALEKNFLSLYADSIEHGLRYKFLDQVMRNADSHIEETKRMLLYVDAGYGRLLGRRQMKKTITGILKDSILYKVYRKLKGIVC